jgi:hypothetical protein
MGLLSFILTRLANYLKNRLLNDNLKWVNNLKLRWSDGKTGLTQGNPYAYLSGYTTSGTYVFSPGTAVDGYLNSEIANTLLSWADIRMLDFGIDWNLFNDLFGGSFDIFSRKTTGIAGTSSVSTQQSLASPCHLLMLTPNRISV